MFSNLRRSLSVSAAPPSLAPSRSLQTATTNTNNRSDRSAVTELTLLPTPATTKDVPSRPQRASKSVQISGGFRAHWAAFKKKVTSGTQPSTSSSPGDSIGTTSYIHRLQGSTPCEQDGLVDVVVVDRVWGEDPKGSNNSDSNTPHEETRAENRLGTTNTDPSSSEVSGFWVLSPILIFFRWRIWPSVWGFFRLRFVDHKSEVHYAKETWFLRKSLALFSALFFVVNWLVPVILLTRPATLSDAIFYYGVGGPGILVYIMPI